MRTPKHLFLSQSGPSRYYFRFRQLTLVLSLLRPNRLQ
jgi:hypothetical protein